MKVDVNATVFVELIYITSTDKVQWTNYQNAMFAKGTLAIQIMSTLSITYYLAHMYLFDIR